jgi:hypothetical protein
MKTKEQIVEQEKKIEKLKVILRKKGYRPLAKELGVGTCTLTRCVEGSAPIHDRYLEEK